MSRGQYWAPAVRWGQRMGDGKLIDAVLGGLTDPFEDCHMGVTAENVADKWGISREAQDELALQSNQRAAAAIQAGRGKRAATQRAPAVARIPRINRRPKRRARAIKLGSAAGAASRAIELGQLAGG